MTGVKFKLYVWGDVAPPAYGADTLVVLATNLREARRLGRNALDYGYGCPNGNRLSVDVSKTAPSLVIDKPDAVYCWWAE